jgi:lysophospholipid acyltransferase (LPLAT)-like uncharacterized protein
VPDLLGMSSLQQRIARIARSRVTQVTLGTLAAGYLQLVWKTSRFELDPANIYEKVVPDLPAIIAMWHGQHFMVPFIKREHRVKVLISLHRDGEINAIAAERLGIETIRGSGGRFDRKGGVGAFREMVDALAQGYSVALTADVPKVARVAGLGIVMLARESGRPIFAVAVATSRRVELDNWDRSTINLPFSHGGMVGGKAIWVPRDADDAILEERRRALEAELNLVTARAYALADRSRQDGSGA